MTFLGPSQTDDRGARASSATMHVDALVADASTRQALVSIRELGKAGLAVGAIDADAQAPGLASRWAAVKSGGARLRRGSERLRRRHPAFLPRARPSLADSGPRRLDRGAAQTSRRGRTARRPGDGARARAGRGDRQDRHAGLRRDDRPAHPARGLRRPSPTQAAGAVDEVGLPAVVKPTRSWAQGEGVGQRLVAVVASTREHALAAIERVLAEGIEVVLQEWLPGDREAISFMRANGKTWARFAQRADRTFPPLGGNSVIRESIPLPDDVRSAPSAWSQSLAWTATPRSSFAAPPTAARRLWRSTRGCRPRWRSPCAPACRFPRLLHDWASGQPSCRSSSVIATGCGCAGSAAICPGCECCRGRRQAPMSLRSRRAIDDVRGRLCAAVRLRLCSTDDLRPARAAATASGMRMSKSQRHHRHAPSSASSCARAPRQRLAGFDTTSVVIGAGPYGLSVSAHLSGRAFATRPSAT